MMMMMMMINELYDSNTTQITIQQPPYNSTLYCQIVTTLRGRGLCSNRQWNIRKCPQWRLLYALKQSGVCVRVCTIARWVSAEWQVY